LKIRKILVFLAIIFSISTHSAKSHTGILESNPSCCCCGGILDNRACEQKMEPCLPLTLEENDPFEPLNRLTFGLNLGLDMIIIEPLAMIYVELLPEYVRDRIGYVLRNLGEPVVFVNNILQGEFEDARVTLGRFFLNSTFGVVGIFDVSTDWGFPYKKTDLGLTFASWGVESGPYLILPILGPSSARDGWGRLGDFFMDPINMYGYALHSGTRTGVQILDVKTDTIDFLRNLREHSVDYYAAIRSWYAERRKSLIEKEKIAIDTPRPDEDD
jgi:phospholipid-binding lipoprotein MlaA